MISMLHTNYLNDYLVNSIRHIGYSAYILKSNIFGACERVYNNINYLFFYDSGKNHRDIITANAELKRELEHLKKLKIENNELRNLLSMREENYQKGKLAVAKIVNLFANDFSMRCLLDIGGNHSVSINDIVFTDKGLVGYVSEVSDNWCRVTLICDIESNIPVIIGDNKIHAIAHGNNKINNIDILIKDGDHEIQNGDIVYSSGYGEIFDEKMPIGITHNTGSNINIKTFVDFRSLTYVTILRKNAKQI